MKDLGKELDTAYLNSNPDLKAQLKNQLYNLSASAFSLQQLLFDLESARLQEVPEFQGIPSGSKANILLQQAFQDIYVQHAKEKGLPLISVMATAQNADGSQLRLTGFERQVSMLKDVNGAEIQSPSKHQMSATTLDYLCAANNHTLPGAAKFT